MEAQPARYVAMPVTCSNCTERQIVHLLGSTGFAQMSEQQVECLKCHELFLVMIPDRIIAGPFPIPNQIRAEKPDKDGKILFVITLDEPADPFPSVSSDVLLVPVAREVADPASFGIKAFVADVQVYDAQTNDPKSSARIMCAPSERAVVVRTTNGDLKSYSGWLKDCILEAFNDQAFSARK